MVIWSLCLLGFDLSVASDSIIITVCYYCRYGPYCDAHLQLVLFCRPAAIAAYLAPHGAGRQLLYRIARNFRGQ